jgi:hypothetical protein
MAWKGSGDNHIWYSFFEPNSGWRPQEVVPHVGGSGQTLKNYNGKAYMTWKGSGDNHIWYSYYTDQTGWVPQEPAINGRTCFDTISLRFSLSLRENCSWRGLDKTEMVQFITVHTLNRQNGILHKRYPRTMDTSVLHFQDNRKCLVLSSLN